MTRSTVNTAQLADWLRRFHALAEEQRDWLTELDSAIGDADHGVNMTRGLNAVETTLDELGDADAAALVKAAGMALISSVGGASGPLYGTFFLRFASAGAVRELDGPALAAALRAGLDGVVARGKAEPGDKTLCDALLPAVDALDAALAKGEELPAALGSAAEAAAAGRDATAPLLAKKGRASYLGERSIGHIDPGSASAALLVQALADTVIEQ